ncbi:MAG: LysR family transcriptional regulator substrate-binding protein [Christensenellales bacterium]
MNLQGLKKNCALQVRLGNCAEFIEQLMADQADLCITYATESLNSATIVSVPLYEEHIYLIAHPSHPLAQKKIGFSR